MKFLIQSNLMDDTQLAMVNRAIQIYPHVYVGVIPFSRELKSDEPIEGTKYIPYGSTLLTTIGSQQHWTGLHFDISTFNYEQAIKHRNDMLNGDVILPLSEAAEYLRQGNNRDVFVRPSEDLKQFSGQVMNSVECADWLTNAALCETSGSRQLDMSTKIVIGEPKNIQAEWRWFVVGGQVVSGSMYRRNGRMFKQRERDTNVIQEAQYFADCWLPDSCCVMDLALVDNVVRVIEFNCINSSGFYDNDVPAIFKALWKFHTK